MGGSIRRQRRMERRYWVQRRAIRIAYCYCKECSAAHGGTWLQEAKMSGGHWMLK
jgi:hypothetical protein